MRKFNNIVSQKAVPIVPCMIGFDQKKAIITYKIRLRQVKKDGFRQSSDLVQKKELKEDQH